MDFGFYKRATGIKHKAAATPFYPRKPVQAQQPAGVRAQQQPATTTVWSVPPPPPSTVVAVAGAETGGRAGAWPPYEPQNYTRNLNFD